MHRFECRKQICASEYAVEKLPTVSVERRGPGVVVYNCHIVHPRERREVVERFHPESSIRFVCLGPNRQGRQIPLGKMSFECFGLKSADRSLIRKLTACAHLENPQVGCMLLGTVPPERRGRLPLRAVFFRKSRRRTVRR